MGTLCRCTLAPITGRRARASTCAPCWPPGRTPTLGESAQTAGLAVPQAGMCGLESEDGGGSQLSCTARLACSAVGLRPPPSRCRRCLFAASQDESSCAHACHTFTPCNRPHPALMCCSRIILLCRYADKDLDRKFFNDIGKTGMFEAQHAHCLGLGCLLPHNHAATQPLLQHPNPFPCCRSNHAPGPPQLQAARPAAALHT